MFPVGMEGGEEDLNHIRSQGRSVTHVANGNGGGEEISAMYAVVDAQ